MSKNRKRKPLTKTGEFIEKSCMAHIELFCSREAVIDGCSAVLEYNSEKIKLDLGDKSATFKGLNLSMDDFNLSQTTISGDIVSIEFSD